MGVFPNDFKVACVSPIHKSGVNQRVVTIDLYQFSL